MTLSKESDTPRRLALAEMVGGIELDLLRIRLLREEVSTASKKLETQATISASLIREKLGKVVRALTDTSKYCRLELPSIRVDRSSVLFDVARRAVGAPYEVYQELDFTLSTDGSIFLTAYRDPDYHDIGPEEQTYEVNVERRNGLDYLTVVEGVKTILGEYIHNPQGFDLREKEKEPQSLRLVRKRASLPTT